MTAEPIRQHFRFIRTPPARGAWNMAVDEALLESVREGAAPAFRLYAWSPPALSLGRNQPALDEYPREVLELESVDVVRRLTGGRGVLHDAELTYSAVLPARRLGSPREAYRRINEMLVAAIRTLGVAAEVHAGGGGDLSPSARPCFADPAPGEIHAAGRKLVGSAQARVDGVVLQQGSILVARTPLLERLAAAGLDDLEGSPSYLEDALERRPPLHALATSIEQAWEARIGPLRSERLDPAVARRAAELEATYADDAWTWRR